MVRLTFSANTLERFIHFLTGRGGACINFLSLFFFGRGECLEFFFICAIFVQFCLYCMFWLDIYDFLGCLEKEWVEYIIFVLGVMRLF